MTKGGKPLASGQGRTIRFAILASGERRPTHSGDEIHPLCHAERLIVAHVCSAYVGILCSSSRLLSNLISISHGWEVCAT